MSAVEAPRVSCAVCGGALGEVLMVHGQPDRFERQVGIEAAGYRREWIGCSQCGAATNRRAPGHAERLEELASEYYEIDFADFSIAEKFDKVMALPAEQSDNAGRVDRIMRALERITATARPGAPAVRRVLDIGSGTGVFPARFLSESAAAGAAWEAVVVEPDPQAAAHLRSLGRFEVIAERFERQHELADFDLVTLNKIVEHAAAPVELLELAASTLAPDRGVLYVEVPDVLTIGRRPPGDNILGALHHHLYSPLSLGFGFERAGVQALDIARVFEPSGKITVFGFGCSTAMAEVMARRFS